MDFDILKWSNLPILFSITFNISNSRSFKVQFPKVVYRLSIRFERLSVNLLRSVTYLLLSSICSTISSFTILTVNLSVYFYPCLFNYAWSIMFDPYKEHQIVTTGLGSANGNRKRRDSNNVIEQI